MLAYRRLRVRESIVLSYSGQKWPFICRAIRRTMPSGSTFHISLRRGQKRLAATAPTLPLFLRLLMPVRIQDEGVLCRACDSECRLCRSRNSSAEPLCPSGRPSRLVTWPSDSPYCLAEPQPIGVPRRPTRGIVLSKSVSACPWA
jgi:hypothetical protein